MAWFQMAQIAQFFVINHLLLIYVKIDVIKHGHLIRRPNIENKINISIGTGLQQNDLWDGPVI